MEICSRDELRSRLLRARIKLALAQPFLATAVMRLPIRECDGASWCPTMATDGYHIFYNPGWTGALRDVEIRGVLAHEILHVILAHSERLGRREAPTWNQACDYAVNFLLTDLGFTLPKGGMYSRDYVGMTADEIYEVIKAKKGALPASANSFSSDNDGIGEVRHAGRDLLRADDPRLARLRAHEAPDAEQLSDLKEGLRRAARQALAGRSAACFELECASAGQSRVDWRSALRLLLSEKVYSDWSSFPFAKKHLHRGYYLPSSGVRAPGHIVFAVDTSGSMTTEDLTLAFDEIRSFRDAFASSLTLIQADDAIRRVEQFEPFEVAEIPERITVKGRGGTDFRPVFSYIAGKAEDPLCLLIYVTDGYGTFPEDEPPFPVLWLIPRGGVDREKVPFGSVIQIA